MTQTTQIYYSKQQDHIKPALHVNDNVIKGNVSVSIISLYTLQAWYKGIICLGLFITLKESESLALCSLINGHLSHFMTVEGRCLYICHSALFSVSFIEPLAFTGLSCHEHMSS